MALNRKSCIIRRLPEPGKLPTERSRADQESNRRITSYTPFDQFRGCRVARPLGQPGCAPGSSLEAGALAAGRHTLLRASDPFGFAHIRPWSGRRRPHRVTCCSQRPSVHRSRVGSYRLRQRHVRFPCGAGEHRFCKAYPGSPGKHRIECGACAWTSRATAGKLTFPHGKTGTGAGDRRRRGSGQGPGRVSNVVQGSRRLHHRPHPSSRTTCWRGAPRSRR